MKRLAFLLALTFAFSSCAAPTAIPTEMGTPSPVTTPTLSSTSSTEAPTVAPTPTENPLAGAPEGATGKDAATGEWTKPNPENPDKPFHYKTVNKEAPAWYTDIIVNPTYQGGIPLINEKGFRTSMALHVWCEEGLQCPTLQHLENGDTISPDPSFTRTLLGKVAARANHIKDIVSWEAAWNAGKEESIPFTTSHGDYIYNTGSNINMYLKKTDLTNPDVLYHYLHASISGDDHGNINIVEYTPQVFGSTKDSHYMYYNFAYLFGLFFNGDMSQAGFLNISNSPGVAGLVSMAMDGQSTYILH